MKFHHLSGLLNQLSDLLNFLSDFWQFSKNRHKVSFCREFYCGLDGNHDLLRYLSDVSKLLKIV